MPRITVKLASNYENISRPVAMRIARDVMKVVDIPDTTDVFMPGEFDQVGQAAGKMGVTDDVKLESYRKVKVTVVDSIRNESVMQAIIRQNEMPPMLNDPRLGISVRPVYIPSDITMSFQYTAPSRTEAIQWRDEFAARRAENRTSMEHEVNYDIPMNEGVLKILAHLHELREHTAGYGENFLQYFKSMQRRPFNVLGTLDGDIDKTTMVVPEKQVNVQGWFDFGDLPVEEKEDGNSTWRIEFTYKVMYHRCTHLYFVYPLMIHQKHISKKICDTRPRYALDELKKNGPIGITALDIIRGNYNFSPPPADGIRFPSYDEWIPGKRRQPPMSVPGITWMIQLNPKDTQDIINLTDLPQVRLTLEMDTYFRKMHKVLQKRGGSHCLLHLYQDDMPMDELILTIDEHLNVRATRPLDLRKQYHLRLSFPTYYSAFTDDAIRSMQVDPHSTLQVFSSILPTLKVSYAMSILIDGKYLPKSYIKWFYKLLQDKGIGFEDGPNGGGGPGGQIGTGGGEGGGLPGGGSKGDNFDKGENGGGGPGGADGGETWGPGDHWSREGVSGNKYVQFLSVITLRS